MNHEKVRRRGRKGSVIILVSYCKNRQTAKAQGTSLTLTQICHKALLRLLDSPGPLHLLGMVMLVVVRGLANVSMSSLKVKLRVLVED